MGGFCFVFEGYNPIPVKRGRDGNGQNYPRPSRFYSGN